MKRVVLSELPPEGVSHDPGILKRVLLRRGETPGLMSFGQAVLGPGQSTSPHAHPDMTEVFFAQSGRGRAVIDGAACPFEAGTCVRADPGESHVLENAGAEPLVVLYFGVALPAAPAPLDP